MEQEQYAIWWLDQSAHELAQALGAPHSSWPEYIQQEFRSRGGRPGHGRLWVASDIEFSGIEWHAGDRAYDAVGQGCGGIVIRVEDIAHVVSWPGFVSDTHLKPVGIELASHNDDADEIARRAKTTESPDFVKPLHHESSSGEYLTPEDLRAHSARRFEEISQQLMKND